MIYCIHISKRTAESKTIIVLKMTMYKAGYLNTDIYYSEKVALAMRSEIPNETRLKHCAVTTNTENTVGLNSYLHQEQCIRSGSN